MPSWIIARQDIRRLWMSPLPWLLLAINQFILAFQFLSRLEFYEATALSKLKMLDSPPGPTEIIAIPALNNFILLLLVLVPLICMRSFAEERRQSSLTLLQTAPISGASIVLGKFLAPLSFFFASLLISLCMVVALNAFTVIDNMHVLAATIGIVLATCCFVAIANLISATTTQPLLAAMGSFGALFFLSILHWADQSLGTSNNLLAALSFWPHLTPFFDGQIHASHSAYFLVLTTAALLMTIDQVHER